MDVQIPFRASFAGSLAGMIEPLRQLGFAPATIPEKVEIDFGETVTGIDMVEGLGRATRMVCTYYPRLWDILDADLSTSILQVGVPSATVNIHALARQLAEVPFEVAAFRSIYGQAWGNPFTDDDAYSPPAFGDAHVTLGWGAAFRGKGHERLVSRNWLHGGPFKVWRYDDVSLVQFHALDADAATALEQARPGHRQIGITPDTGFLQTHFVYRFDLSGLYDLATRTMKVVVLGRDIPNRELLEWAAIRKYQPQAPDRIVDEVAFIFPQEEEALANLPRLWRYGHQCWTIRNGQEVRLDLDYQPPDTTPDWAR